MQDDYKNFARGTVSLGYDAAATSIVMTTGHSARFPTVPFNFVWWNSTDYADPAEDPNVEICRCTAIATETWTITRAQEGTTATTKNTASKVYKAVAAITAKFLDLDIPKMTVVALASDAAANATATGVEITGLEVASLPVGKYLFKYWIRYLSSVTTTGVKFGVNFTGTQTAFAAWITWQESTTAGSTGAASGAAAGGRLKAGGSARALSTTAPNLGPSASVDVIDVDMFCVVEGIIIVTVAGNLELWHASETANSTTVKAGSTLVLTKAD